MAGLTFHAPEIVRWLAGLGVPFAREDGRMVQRSFGGQKKKRTAYAKSSTGKALMTALIDEARKFEAAGLIHRLPHHELIDLTVENGVCRAPGEGLFGVAPGQSAVFYDDDDQIICGGIIA